jgi:MFS family permease
MSAAIRERAISIYPILWVNFVGTLGFSIVLPFLVFLVTRWGGNAVVYGIVGATYSVFQLVGAPILGRWSDTFGRRRVLLLSQAGTLVSWVILLLAFTLPTGALAEVDSRLLGTFALTLPLIVLFVARAFDGLTGGNISVANAYLADISSDTTRAANFGKMAVAANFGFILGPALAGILGETPWGEMLPVLAAALISAIATWIVAVRLPETNPCLLSSDPERPSVRNVLGQDHRACYELKAAPKLSMREILRLPGIPLLLAIYFLVMLGFNFFYIAFPVHAARGLEWSLGQMGMFFVAAGFLMALVQGPVLSRLAGRISDRALVITGSLLLAGSFVAFVDPGIPVIYLGVVLLALGNGLMWPSVLSVLSRLAGNQYQGAVQGFAASCGAVASIVGFVVGGFLYGILGASVFLVSAGVIAVVFLFSLWLPGQTRADGPSPEVRVNTRCTHMESILTAEAVSDGCRACLELGDSWVHLRRCTSCGHVGCCSSSKNTHATKHYQESGHPIVQSHQPGERWYWCYLDEMILEIE